MSRLCKKQGGTLFYNHIYIYINKGMTCSQPELRNNYTFISKRKGTKKIIINSLIIFLYFNFFNDLIIVA